MREFTQGEIPVNAMNVGKPLARGQLSPNIKEKHIRKLQGKTAKMTAHIGKSSSIGYSQLKLED